MAQIHGKDQAVVFRLLSREQDAQLFSYLPAKRQKECCFVWGTPDDRVRDSRIHPAQPSDRMRRNSAQSRSRGLAATSPASASPFALNEPILALSARLVQNRTFSPNWTKRRNPAFPPVTMPLKGLL